MHLKKTMKMTPCSRLINAWILLLALLIPASLQAQFVCATNNGELAVLSYTGPGGDVTIPDTIDGLPVTSIGMNAFYSRTTLTNLTIGSNVRSVGGAAFESCTSLTNANIGRGLTNLGYHAFFNCSQLETYVVDSANPSFKTEAGVLFDKLQTKVVLCPARKPGSYTIPAGVVVIGNGAFDNCRSLTGVSIPDSVVNIEDGAFYACTELTSVAMGTSVANIGNLAFYWCTHLGSITIPNSVTNIYGAFSDCTALNTVTLGNGLLNMNGAFVRCSSLGSVVIPNSVTSLEGSFGGCSSLTNVTIPNSVTNLGRSLFSACGKLTSVSIPGSVTSFGEYLFDYCVGLTNLTLPDNLKTIGTYAFRNCYSLESLVIPDSVTSLGQFAFQECRSITTIAIGKNVPVIWPWTFAGCNHLAVIAVDSLNPNYTSVNGVLFDKDQHTLHKYPPGKTGSYSVPGTVATIAMSAFENSGVSHVIIPPSVTSIGMQAFAGCAKLSAIYLTGNAPSGDSSIFSSSPGARVYYLPNTTGWQETFGGRMTVLWNPQMQPSIQAGQFGFTLTGATNLVLVIEACTNLTDPAWIVIQTNTLTEGSAVFTDPQFQDHPRRFYRLRAP
jgi:hypothetical protein